MGNCTVLGFTPYTTDEKAVANYIYFVMSEETKRVYIDTWNDGKLFFRYAIAAIVQAERRNARIENVMVLVYDLIKGGGG